MKWGDLLRKSWKYLKEHKTLWYLGILAALTEGGVSNFGNGSSWQGDKMPEDFAEFEKYGGQVANWITAHTLQISIIALAIFVVSLIILYISYSARAGLIKSVSKLDESDKKPEFHHDFHVGQGYFWKMLGITILLALVAMALVFAIILVAGGLILLSIAASLWFLILAVPVTLASIFGLFAIAVYLNVLTYLSYRVTVIENKKIVASIQEARELIHHNFGNLILAWLIHLAINTVYTIALAVAGVIAIGILTGIGFGLYYAAGATLVWIYAAVVFVAILAAILILSGALNAYFSTFWTLVYRQLEKQK